MPSFSESSKNRLLTCDPRLQELLNEAIKIIDFTVIEGHRGQEAQDKAFREGKSKLRWPKGNHNALPSRAVDIAPVFYDVAGKIDWNDLVAFGRLMGYIQCLAVQRGIKLRFGLDWDGDFRSVNRDPDESFFDAPHLELVDP
jgi:peptidoglycan L-alanyl-D-glutamate endopeptidase CwlK